MIFQGNIKHFSNATITTYNSTYRLQLNLNIIAQPTYRVCAATRPESLFYNQHNYCTQTLRYTTKNN